MSDRDEANTVLALELDEKVKNRIYQILRDEPIVKDLLYYAIADRLVYDRNKVERLAENMHVLEREKQFKHMQYVDNPWRMT